VPEAVVLVPKQGSRRRLIVLCAGAPDTPEIAREMSEAVERVRAHSPHLVWIDEMLPKDPASPDGANRPSSRRRRMHGEEENPAAPISYGIERHARTIGQVVWLDR
jgi:hypothetical protein